MLQSCNDTPNRRRLAGLRRRSLFIHSQMQALWDLTPLLTEM
jgi:hypothetical protein